VTGSQELNSLGIGQQSFEIIPIRAGFPSSKYRTANACAQIFVGESRHERAAGGYEPIGENLLQTGKGQHHAHRAVG
jgi:hypothetical protein